MRFFATAAKGTEGALRDELRALRLSRVRADRGGVHFEGDLVHGMTACLWSRVAMRVQLEVGSFPAASDQELYDGVRGLDWRPFLTPGHTLAVSATCKDSKLTHSHFIALKTKDAVVDQFRDAAGARPDVDTHDPDVAIVVRLVKDQATVYLDLAGDALHKRGYRTAQTDAMLKETLAAAVISLGGWTPDLPFMDPLCGSGTLAIEAALMARRIAPGISRRFAFERCALFTDREARTWGYLREEARAGQLPRAPMQILASDGDEHALAAARDNAHRAGVAGDITLSQLDARTIKPMSPPGYIIADPPYGDRMASQPLQLAGFFRQFGEALRPMRGHTVVLISGNPLLSRAFELRPDWSHTLYNGPIECRLLRYRL